MPTNTDYGSLFDTAGKNGALSQSDKIAIGIGVGFGVPTLLIGLGAWLCVRRRAEKTEKDSGVVEIRPSPQISPPHPPQTSPQQPPGPPGPSRPSLAGSAPP